MIRSICPKCGKMGTQDIHFTHKNRPDLKYLYMKHESGEYCYVGRVRSTEEALGELNRPENVKDYEPVIEEIIDYANSLTRKTIHGKTVASQLQSILGKYGLWKVKSS